MRRRIGDLFYLIPPAGTPISLGDISEIVRMRFFSRSSIGEFEDRVKRQTGADYCFFFNSGRTALAYILNSLRKIENNKTEVIIPAYTCFSVPAAIARSGLKMRLVDIAPHTLDYDYEKLQDQNFENVLAIVGCNLFGVISDWKKLQSIAVQERVFLVDDAAQSMGSLHHGKVSGGFGDVGFYSMGRGKNLSTISGGILITSNEQIASNIEECLKDTKRTGPIYETKILMNIMLYSLFLHPRLYWLPDKMPFLNLGQTVFDQNFIMSRLSDLQKCAGAVLYPKLEDINSIRSGNARAIWERISKNTGFSVPGYSSDDIPIYLRLPVLARNRDERDKIISALQRAGIKSSAMYPSTIRRIEGIEKYLSNPGDEFEGAQSVADRLFTLPTHHLVKDRDVDKIIECLMGF